LENHSSVLVFFLQPGSSVSSLRRPAALTSRSPEALLPQRRSLSCDMSPGYSSHRPRRLCWLPLALPRRAACAERPPRMPKVHDRAARRPEPGPASVLPLPLFYSVMFPYKARWDPFFLAVFPFLLPRDHQANHRAARQNSPRSLHPVAEPPELFRLKCANDRRTIAISLTYFKRNNPLVCRVSARYNHGSTGSKQVCFARRRVHIIE
jgi:hypothetical protein